MAELISSDRPNGGEALATLAALLDALLPASDDGRLPSASELDFVAHLERFDPDYLSQLAVVLRAFDESFVRLGLEARVALVGQFAGAEPAAFQDLLRRVYDCYYQSEPVRIAIGATPGPPFPHGNTVAGGDLTLLDPVIRNRERFRYRRA